MKRILYILIALVATVSCTKYEFEAPAKKTEHAFNIFKEGEETAENLTSIMEMLQKANEWLNESDSEKQDSIEDANFRYYKLRVSDNTIKLLSVENDINIDIVTDGKDINEVGSSWMIELYHKSPENKDALSVVCDDNGFWSFDTDDKYFLGYKGSFTVANEKVEDEHTKAAYRVNGKGKFLQRPHYNDTYEINIDMRDVITVNYENIVSHSFNIGIDYNGFYNLYSTSFLSTIDGEFELLETVEHLENYIITVDVAHSGVYVVKYRGVVEKWDYNYYFDW